MNEALNQLAEDYWEFVAESSPVEALMRGDHRFDDRFDDVSLAAEDRKIARRRGFAAKAEAIDPAALTADERITREVLIHLATANADYDEQRLAEMDVNHAIGMQAMLPVAVPQYPLTAPEHALAMPSHFRGMARAMDDAADRLRSGVAGGRTPMASTAEKTAAQVDAWLAGDPASDPLLRLRSPEGWDGEAAWREEMARVVADEVRPALGRWRDTIVEEVLPAARPEDKPGLCWTPGGEEAYRVALYRYTTTRMTPDQIHDVGLQQIARLGDEYRILGEEVLGTTDLPEIYRRLREDKDLHFTAGKDVVAASERAMAKAKAAMGDWFGCLPKADCVVAETPTGPTAFYFRPAIDGSRPGTFFVNTAEPTRWGRFEIEAMAYHEGIPGHHLQLAIAQELDGIPEFRKHAFISAYGEGWGLYTERLADEMGLYSGPLERIGMLSADSMRAGRLVVDTGLHAKGWSRRQAIDYFRDNSPMSQGTIEGEIDRYIGGGGQACSYMIGRLEIQRMRREAEQAMGDRFTIKGFHDTVLGSGLVPLGTLERMVKEWAAA
ncbi:MAG: hypothetical protein A2Z12_02840 [Actinobacteria bacterium RBG_16_68_21]|nr:MAG: hypothetical protein A2Z12_02840 [Actinobacteria bacterium RBG_16_68_21]